MARLSSRDVSLDHSGRLLLNSNSRLQHLLRQRDDNRHLLVGLEISTAVLELNQRHKVDDLKDEQAEEVWAETETRAGLVGLMLVVLVVRFSLGVWRRTLRLGRVVGLVRHLHLTVGTDLHGHMVVRTSHHLVKEVVKVLALHHLVHLTEHIVKISHRHRTEWNLLLLAEERLKVNLLEVPPGMRAIPAGMLVTMLLVLMLVVWRRRDIVLMSGKRAAICQDCTDQFRLG